MTDASQPSRIRRGRKNASFTAISNALITAPDLSPEARLTLIYLLSKPEDWELQIKDIRRLLGRGDSLCGRNKAYEVIKELKAARFVVACDDLDNGRFAGVTYYVFDEPHADPDAIRELHRDGGDIVEESPPCPENRDAAPCPQKRDTVNRDSTKERKKQTTEGLFGARGNAFDEWWKAYPHKVAKPAAKRAFEMAIRKATLEALLDGVQRYIAVKPPDRHFCNPATWLNGERWLDAPAERERQPGLAWNASRKPRTDPLFDLCQSELLKPLESERDAIEHRR